MNRFSIVYESISLGHLRNELYKIDTRVLGRASSKMARPKRSAAQEPVSLHEC